jgi:hypothetical protein
LKRRKMTNTTKPKRGGKRAGSGAKPQLDDAITPKVYIDRRRWEGYADLGGGNFSAGVRAAYDYLQRYGLLEKVAAEHDRIKANKEGVFHA